MIAEEAAEGLRASAPLIAEVQADLMRRVATVSEVAAQMETEAREKRTADALAETAAVSTASVAAAAAARRGTPAMGRVGSDAAALRSRVNSGALASMELAASPVRARRVASGVAARDAKAPPPGSPPDGWSPGTPQHPALRRLTERRRPGSTRARSGSFMSQVSSAASPRVGGGPAREEDAFREVRCGISPRQRPLPPFEHTHTHTHTHTRKRTHTHIRSPVQRIVAAMRRGRRRSSVERETIAEARRGLQTMLRAAAKFRSLLKRVRARRAAEGAVGRPSRPGGGSPGGGSPVGGSPGGGARARERGRSAAAGRQGGPRGGRGEGASDALAPSPVTGAQAPARPRTIVHDTSLHVPHPRARAVPGTVVAPPRKLLVKSLSAAVATPAQYAALTEARRARQKAAVGGAGMTAGASGFRAIMSLAAASGVDSWAQSRDGYREQ